MSIKPVRAPAGAIMDFLYSSEIGGEFDPRTVSVAENGETFIVRALSNFTVDGVSFIPGDLAEVRVADLTLMRRLT